MKLKFTTRALPVADIDPNVGQIAEVPRNPRKISDEDMAALKKSIHDDPDLLNLWKLTVYPLDGRWVALSGNQRLQACRELKIKRLTCDILDETTPPEMLRKIVIKANRMAGEDDLDLLKTEWDFEELTSMWDFPDLRFPTTASCSPRLRQTKRSTKCRNTWRHAAKSGTFG